MKKQSYVIIASAVLVVSLAASTITSAATGVSSSVRSSLFSETKTGRTHVPIMGKVSAITGTTITITNKKGVVYTIDAASAQISNRTNGSTSVKDLSTLKVGDTIAVIGTLSGSTVTADSILEGVAASAKIPGKITAVTSSGFTIEVGGRQKNAIAKEFLVTLSDTTAITENGAVGARANLAVGKTVSVSGVIDSTNNTVSASGVNIITPKEHTRLIGTVTVIDGSTITIVGKDGTTHLIDATRANIMTDFERNRQTSSLAKIKVGDKILVIGAPTTTDSLTITATLIQDIQ